MERTEIIDTKAGKIQGIKDDGIEIFKGIPYTERVVGNLRFNPPVPAKRFPGVFHATEFGPVSPQVISPKLISAPYPQSEPDCLTLNIWTPSTNREKRPVMVWIHGGGLRSHDARSYNGEFLVKRGDLVVVSLNYRLNALGFSFMPGVVTAPLGLLDQITALKWVRDNIENFGGDPNNITIFGESAGGWSVSTLLAMPEAKDLFHRAIAQSGGCNAAGFRASEGEDLSKRILAELGIQKDDIDALQKISAYELVDADSKVWEEKLKEKHWPITTPPYIDGEYIPEHPLNLIANGAAVGVDLLIGTNLNESSSMKLDDSNNFEEVSENGMQNWMKLVMKTLGQNEDKALSLIDAYRETRKNEGTLSAQKVLDAFLTDFEFHISAIRTAEAQSVQHPNTFMYLFTWPSSFMDGLFGSFHTLEIPFVFGVLDDPFWKIISETSEEAKKLSENIMDSWIAFARTGNPSHAGIPEWPRYNTESRSTMLLGKEIKAVDDPYGKERMAWKGIM
jgi:para-nitrobenzyl esterase